MEFDQKPPKPMDAREQPAQADMVLGDSSGLASEVARRGYISGADADPSYPKSADFYRTPIVRKDITRRDWYAQGNPRFGFSMEDD